MKMSQKHCQLGSWHSR